MILKEIGAQPRRAPAQFKPRLYCLVYCPRGISYHHCTQFCSIKEISEVGKLSSLS